MESCHEFYGTDDYGYGEDQPDIDEFRRFCFREYPELKSNYADTYVEEVGETNVYILEQKIVDGDGRKWRKYSHFEWDGTDFFLVVEDGDEDV